MPAARFKPLSLGSLPRVMVAILAMPEEDRRIIAREMCEQPLLGLMAGFFGAGHVTFGRPTVDNLAEIFDALLQITKEERRVFVKAFDAMLDHLYVVDFFGMEGQTDPRGDHRD